MSTPTHITLSGAPEGFDARLLLKELDRANAPVIHVARDDKRLAHVPVLTFPGWDCLPFDRVSPNADVSAARLATLATLVAEALPGPFLLLTTLNAATQRVPARELLRGASFTAQVGNRIDESALRAFLVRMGFSQSPTVTEPGDFAFRGGIIDIFPPGAGGPVRLDLFGDVLDGARRFDPATQRTTETLSGIELAPVCEVILDEPAITRFRQKYRVAFGAAGSDDPLYEAVSAGRKHQGVDIADQYETRKIAMEAKHRMDTVYKPCPPELLYLDDAAWQATLKARRVVQTVALPQATGAGVLDGGGRIGRNFSPERQQEKVNLFKSLSDHVKVMREAGPVIVASYSEGARDRLQGLLADEGLTATALIKDFRDVPDSHGGVYLAVWPLEPPGGKLPDRGAKPQPGRSGGACGPRGRALSGAGNRHRRRGAA